ncbi:MAG: M1 family aminopeptidase [Bacteroidota bacterium]
MKTILFVLFISCLNNIFAQNQNYYQYIQNRERSVEIYERVNEIEIELNNNQIHNAIVLMNSFIQKYPVEGKFMYYYRGIAKKHLNEMNAAKIDFQLAKSSGYIGKDSLVDFWLSKEFAANILADGYIENPDFKEDNNLKPVFSRIDSLQGALRSERACFDVTSYNLKVRIYPEEQKIKGKNLIYFNMAEKSKTIQLDLFANYSIDSILFNGSELKYTREFNAVFIELSEELAVGKNYCIQVNYSGIPRIAPNPPWNGGFVWSKKKNKHWIGVACEHLGASSWWPNKDHLSDKPDSMRITIEVPSDLTAVSNGNLIRSYPVDSNYNAFEWFVSYPINNYNVTLYAGNFIQFGEEYTNANGTYYIDYYVLPQNEKIAREYYSKTKDVFEVFEKVFGEFPFKNDGAAFIESPFMGMEHQSAIAIGDNYGKNKRRNYEDTDYDYLVVHETAHEWWGNAVAIGDMADAWINEGFGTYAELLFMEEKYGYNSYIKGAAVIMQSIFNIWPLVGVRHVNDNSFLGGDIYNKGAIMLHNLRCIMDNDDLFKKLIKDFYNKYKYRICDTDDFLNFVTEITGENYLPFLNTFLYNADPPLLRYATVKDSNDIIFYYRFEQVELGFEMPFNIITDKYESLRFTGKEIIQSKRIANTSSFYLPTGYIYSINMKKNSFTYFWNDRLRTRNIENYYDDNKLKEKGFLVDKYKEGEWKYYYPNGNLKFIINYCIGLMNGKYESFYETGERDIIMHYKNDTMQGDYICFKNNQISYRKTYENDVPDSIFYYIGDTLESKGKLQNEKDHGIWQIFHKNGTLAAIGEFNQGKQIFNSWKYFDDKGNQQLSIDTVVSVNIAPEYRGGTNTMYNDLYSKLILKTEQIPKESGTAYISFIVSPTGIISNFTIENSYAPDFANEIINILQTLPRWIPGYCNGKPVCTKVVFPFKYKKV